MDVMPCDPWTWTVDRSRLFASRCTASTMSYNKFPYLTYYNAYLFLLISVFSVVFMFYKQMDLAEIHHITSPHLPPPPITKKFRHQIFPTTEQQPSMLYLWVPSKFYVRSTPKDYPHGVDLGSQHPRWYSQKYIPRRMYRVGVEETNTSVWCSRSLKTPRMPEADSLSIS